MQVDKDRDKQYRAEQSVLLSFLNKLFKDKRRCDFMPDYKKMYFTLFRATEQAINTLIEAQRECEELYIREPETELRVIPLPDRAEEDKE